MKFPSHPDFACPTRRLFQAPEVPPFTRKMPVKIQRHNGAQFHLLRGGNPLLPTTETIKNVLLTQPPASSALLLKATTDRLVVPGLRGSSIKLVGQGTSTSTRC